jgi:hypothetical protein
MIPASGSPEILQERCGKVTGSFRKTPEIIRKNPKIFQAEYCFQKSPELPRTGSFRTGLFDLGLHENEKLIRTK